MFLQNVFVFYFGIVWHSLLPHLDHLAESGQLILHLIGPDSWILRRNQSTDPIVALLFFAPWLNFIESS